MKHNRTLQGVAPPSPRPSAHDRPLPTLLSARAAFVTRYAELLDVGWSEAAARSIALGAVRDGLPGTVPPIYDLLCERAIWRAGRE